MVELSTGAIAKIKLDTQYVHPDGLIVKATSLELSGKKYVCRFTDGEDSIKGVLATQVMPQVSSGAIREGSILRLVKYHLNNISELTVLVVEAEVLETGDGDAVAAAPSQTASGTSTPAGPSTPMECDIKAQDLNVAGDMTPAVKREKTAGTAVARQEPQSPGPTPSPSEARSHFPKTPAQQSSPPVTPFHINMKAAPPTPSATAAASTTPSRSSQPLAERRNYDCVEQLNPYSDTWVLKAKLVRKSPLRSVGKATAMSVFTVELLDHKGKQIQGTFWRAAADKFHDILEEGQLYIWSRMTVKPCNKAYSAVKCDYEVHFTDRTEVVPASTADQAAAVSMVAEVDLVPLDQLLVHLTRKAPVDVLGVVLSCGSQGTVKRKSDSTELTRREVTIGDSSGRSVAITLWGEANEKLQLEKSEGGPVLLQVSACRVTEFNGCSLSTLTKSTVSVDPTSPAAEELRSWYTSHSASTTFTPVGQPGTGAGGGGGTPQERDKLGFLSDLDIPVEQLPGPDDKKGLWSNFIAHTTRIDGDRTMYYLANADTGKKVTEQNGQFLESDGSSCEKAEYRYVLSVKMGDSRAEMNVNLFNKEGQMMLGCTADELHLQRTNQPALFDATLKAAQWREWVVKVNSKAHEYKGDRKARHTITSVRPVDYVADAYRYLAIINGSA